MNLFYDFIAGVNFLNPIFNGGSNLGRINRSEESSFTVTMLRLRVVFSSCIIRAFLTLVNLLRWLETCRLDFATVINGVNY